MYKLLPLFLIFFMYGVQPVNAQYNTWSFGLSASGLISTMEANDNPLIQADTENNTKPSFGFRIIHQFSKGFGITVLPNYSQIGLTEELRTQSFTNNLRTIIESDITIHYFRIPFMASWFLGKNKLEGNGFNLSVGIYTGVKISDNIDATIIQGTSNEDFEVFEAEGSGNFDVFDAGIRFEARRMQRIFNQNFSFEISSSQGFSNIEKENSIGDLRISTITFGIGYMF